MPKKKDRYLDEALRHAAEVANMKGEEIVVSRSVEWPNQYHIHTPKCTPKHTMQVTTVKPDKG